MGGDQRELLLSEGTVILHITFALKQDQVYITLTIVWLLLCLCGCYSVCVCAGVGEGVSEDLEGDPISFLLPLSLHCRSGSLSGQDTPL